MKNKIAFTFLCISLFTVLFATKSSAQKFEVGNDVIGLGIGLGSTYGYTTSSSSPALSAQYEHGIWNIAGPGVISLGGFLGYKSYSYDGIAPGYTFSQKWSYTIIGLRSAYHYNGFQGSKFDPYGGLMLSYDIVSASYTSSDHTYDYLYRGAYGSTFRITLFLGGRYYFSENWAAFGELGFGNAILSLGLAYKL